MDRGRGWADAAWARLLRRRWRGRWTGVGAGGCRVGPAPSSSVERSVDSAGLGGCRVGPALRRDATFRGAANLLSTPRSLSPERGLPTIVEMSSSSTTAARTSVRPEIQALRAVAIGCVVLYHFWPAALPAGFVGVDVFFVVSGFLITGLLLRDVERFDRVRLREFYVRRIRRILPAALVVLSACAVATLLFVPRIEWRPFFQQILVERPLRAELAPGARLADPAPGRPRVDAGPALLVALGGGAVLPRLAAAHHRGALAGASASAVVACSWSPACSRQPRSPRSCTAWSSPARTTTSPTSRPSRGRGSSAWAACSRCLPARRRGATAPDARPRRVDGPRGHRRRVAHLHRPSSSSRARSRWCRCSAPPPSSGRGCRGRRCRSRRSRACGPCSGSAASRTRSTSGTGRSSCSRRTSRGGRARRPVMVLLLVLSIVVADASKRWIEDPFRRAVACASTCGCRAPGASRSPRVPPWPPSCSSHPGRGRLHRREARRAAVPAVRRRRLTAAQTGVPSMVVGSSIASSIVRATVHPRSMAFVMMPSSCARSAGSSDERSSRNSSSIARVAVGVVVGLAVRPDRQREVLAEAARGHPVGAEARAGDERELQQLAGREVLALELGPADAQRGAALVQALVHARSDADDRDAARSDALADAVRVLGRGCSVRLPACCRRRGHPDSTTRRAGRERLLGCDVPVNRRGRDTPGLHGCRDCGKLDEFNISNGVPCCVPFESLPGSA